MNNPKPQYDRDWEDYGEYLKQIRFQEPGVILYNDNSLQLGLEMIRGRVYLQLSAEQADELAKQYFIVLDKDINRFDEENNATRTEPMDGKQKTRNEDSSL